MGWSPHIRQKTTRGGWLCQSPSTQQQIRRQGRLLRGPGAQVHSQAALSTFPEHGGKPLGHRSSRGRRGFGVVSGRGHGKDSRGLGRWGWNAHAPPHLRPLPMDWSQEAASVRRRLLSGCRPGALSHSGTIFGSRRKGKKRKQRTGLLFSVEPWPGKDSRARWDSREGGRCQIRRSWQVWGSQRRAQLGHPWPFTHTWGPRTAVIPQERGTNHIPSR